MPRSLNGTPHSVFSQFTLYVHIQAIHASLLLYRLPTPIAIGKLKNEVVECKHREAKNLHTTQGVGYGAIGGHSGVRFNINCWHKLHLA